jgi:hypothetical protein
MKHIEEGQPFRGTVRFLGANVPGDWVLKGSFLYLHLDPTTRQDIAIAATVRMDGAEEHTIAVPLAGAELIVLAE